jgi:hypothetical protein
VWWPERWVAAPTGGRDPAGHNGASKASWGQQELRPQHKKGGAISDRPATCVRLLVEGRDRLSLFRVLLIATDSFDAARHAARKFVEANGAQLVAFDEEETAIVQ